MAAYIALRVIKKADEGGVQAGQAYYNQFFAIPLYQQFQADTDAILIAEGHGNLIPQA